MLKNQLLNIYHSFCNCINKYYNIMDTLFNLCLIKLVKIGMCHADINYIDKFIYNFSNNYLNELRKYENKIYNFLKYTRLIKHNINLPDKSIFSIYPNEFDYVMYNFVLLHSNYKYKVYEIYIDALVLQHHNYYIEAVTKHHSYYGRLIYNHELNLLEIIPEPEIYKSIINMYNFKNNFTARLIFSYMNRISTQSIMYKFINSYNLFENYRYLIIIEIYALQKYECRPAYIEYQVIGLEYLVDKYNYTKKLYNSIDILDIYYYYNSSLGKQEYDIYPSDKKLSNIILALNDIEIFIAN